jgi:hypothetical protein
MALLTRKTPIPAPVSLPPRSVSTEVYSTIVDSLEGNLTPIVAFIAGSPWSVTYYNQVLGANSQPTDLDTASNSVLQKYNKVNEFILKVTEALTSVNDVTASTVAITGKAQLYPAIVPYIGDMFTAHIDGQLSALKVTGIERLTHNRDSVYCIEYVVNRFYGGGDVIAALEERTVRSYHFNRDMIVGGMNPLLETSVHHQRTIAINAVRVLLNTYLELFFHKSTKSLCHRQNGAIIYDPYTVDFLLSITNTDEHPVLMDCKRVVSSEELEWRSTSLHSILINRGNVSTGLCGRNYKVISPKKFQKVIRTASYTFAIIDGILVLDTTDLFYQELPILEDLTPIPPPARRVYMSQAATDSLFPPPSSSSYILSEGAYNGTAPTLTLFDQAVLAYLSKNTVDPFTFSKLTDNFNSLTESQQYVIGPILIFLLKAFIKGEYNDSSL